MSSDENKAMVFRFLEAWNVIMRPGATGTDRDTVAAMETVAATSSPEI